MIKKLFALFAMMICFCSLATETRGLLNIDKEEAPLIIGEAHTYELILVPFEKEKIVKEDLESTFFLDFFYINEILSISESEQNSDAIVIKLNMTLTKEVKFEGFQIWQFKDANIPIEFNLVEVSTKETVAVGAPQLFEEPFSFKRSLKWYEWLAIFVVILLVLIALNEN